MFPYPVTPKSMLYNLQSSFTINNIDSVVVVVVVVGGEGVMAFEQNEKIIINEWNFW